jgi:tetratricopeptide (TPR) repeat protein
MTTQTFLNFYELLVVPPSASPEEIREAVRKQRRQWVKRQASADPAKRTEAEVKVRQLDEAERTLLDPVLRGGFDEQLRNYRPPAPTPDGQVGDWLEKAHAYLDQGHVAAAHTAAVEAINQRGGEDAAWYIRAHASFLMGQARDAEYEFAEAIRLQPANPDYHFDLGDVFAQQEKWASALREFETALRFQPKNPQYRTAIAQVYCDTGKARQALTIMEQVVAEFGDNEVFRYYLAFALHNSVVESTSRFADGHLPTSEAQVALAERHADRIEGLRIDNSDVREMASTLREMASEARKPRWVRSGHLKAYIFTFIALLLLPGAGGNAFAAFLGFVAAALLVWAYVYRHRKPAWQHRRNILAGQILEPGI